MTKTIRGKAAKVSRRHFVVGSAAASGGLALGFHVPFGIAPAAAQADAPAQVNIWVAIKPDDTCVIRVVRSEMGQGTITGLAQLVAEELECDWKKVTVESITPGRNLASKRVWGDMSTGGSRGIRTSQDYVRRGGATARLMLLQAAADEWKVPVGELTVADGVIRHAASNRQTTYGKVAAAASKLTEPDPKSIKLKDPRSWKVAGQPLKRLDTADKLNGSKVYAIDVQLPGMLNAAIKDSPVFGGKVKSYDEAKIAGRPGVKKVVKVGRQRGRGRCRHLVARQVGARRTADRLGRRRRRVRLGRDHRRAPHGRSDGHRHQRRAPERRCAQGDRGSGQEGRGGLQHAVPFARLHGTDERHRAHHAGHVEVWIPSQNVEASLAALSEASGLPIGQCEAYRIDLGGGFGRRGGTQDYTRQAVAIAKEFPGIPVKLIWSREEDQAHDFFRPISQCKMSAGLDAQGNLVGLHMRVSGQSINATLNPAGIVGGKDRRQLQGFWEEPGDAQLGYTVPNLLIEYAMRNTHVPVGPWRGVNTNQNGIYMECFIEECARAAGKDSLEFRRALMSKHPKHLAVLNAAAEKGDWGKPLPLGVHRGIAQFMGYGSYSAATAEVSVSPQGKLKVHRMVLALNCGHAVNPDQIAAQVEGSVAYGLSAALYEECRVKDGRMVDLNFDTYQIMRLAEMPKVETVVVPTYDFWGGVGEPTICVVVPAVLNAIMAATGKPVRSLPMKNVKLV